MATKPTIKPGDKAWWCRPDGSRLAVTVEKVFKTTCWGMVVTNSDRISFDITKGIPLAEISPAAGEAVPINQVSYKTNSADIPSLSYKTDLERVIDDCRKLGRSDLLTLRNLIDDLLDEDEEFSVPVNPSREVVKREVIGSVVYQLEKISCGKERCRRCPHGHGPYWYSYQRRDGRVVSKYIGKTLDL